MPLLSTTPTLSRRTLLRGLGGSAALGALAGCGVPAAYVAPGDRAATDRSATEQRLTWANWPLYIDTDDEHPSRRPTLEAFEKRSGISVEYIEEINDNDEFFGKISPSLMNHQPTDRDLIVISDWMCGRFVRLGWVQEMDRSRQPNVTEYLDPLLRSPAFDPGREFTVPWQSGITGIAYNRREARPGDPARVRPVGGGPQGPGDPAVRHGRGVRAADAGQRRGHHRLDGGRLPRSATRWRSRWPRARSAASPATTTSRTSPAVTSWPAEAYSGDVIQLQADDPDIEFVVPEEGAELWSESLMIPNLARHKANAERLIDYYYQPEVAADLAAWVNYVCPVPAARGRSRLLRRRGDRRPGRGPA